MAGGDEWLDAEAAARHLDFHVNTIYQMVRDGRLPALRFPVRIRREDIDACLERCRSRHSSGRHLQGRQPRLDDIVQAAGRPNGQPSCSHC